MDDVSVILRPLITEKVAHFATTRNQYTFAVNRAVSKIQIKNAIERLYNVKVRDVRTANYKGKPRRRGRQLGSTAAWKKAIVVLHPDYRIDLF
jgi:large subunit ribosomal protein L23